MFSCTKRIWRTKALVSARNVIESSGAMEISNEPLQKASKVAAAAAAAEPSPKTEPAKVGKPEERGQKKESPAAAAAAAAATAVPKSGLEESGQVVEARSIVPRETSLVERKDLSEVLLNVDPFDDVPGPEILRKISSVWKYLPAIGCQATVSAILSFFKLAKIGNAVLGSRQHDRPFNKLFRKYGPIVRLQGPLGAQIVLICRPEHIAKVYDQEGKYPIRSTLDSVDKCRSQTRKTSGGPFNLSGIEWEEMRKAIEEPLVKSGEKYFRPIEEAAGMFVKRIHAIRNRQNEVGDGLMSEINKWGLECLCLITLDKSLGFLHQDASVHASETNRLLKAVTEATEAICKCEGGFQFWRFMSTPASASLAQACDVVDGILSKHIRYAQVNLSRKKDEIAAKGKPAPDLPFIESLLLNECMTPDEVLTCILDILLIGVNTSSTTLGFLLYHLAQNQRAQRSLFKEVKDALPEKQSKLEYARISSMPFLQACLKESLRLRMPMPILTRVLAADVVLSNYRIPKGTYMVMDAQAACLKETDFEKPDKFLPERWLEPFSVHPFAFLPFGHGLRSCVGRYLAEAQLKTCAAKIVRQFHIEYNYGDIETLDSVISFPNKPLRLSFIEREE